MIDFLSEDFKDLHNPVLTRLLFSLNEYDEDRNTRVSISQLIHHTLLED